MPPFEKVGTERSIFGKSGVLLNMGELAALRARLDARDYGPPPSSNMTETAVTAVKPAGDLGKLAIDTAPILAVTPLADEKPPLRQLIATGEVDLRTFRFR